MSFEDSDFQSAILFFFAKNILDQGLLISFRPNTSDIYAVCRTALKNKTILDINFFPVGSCSYNSETASQTLHCKGLR